MEHFFDTELITSFMKERGLSKKEFSKLCGFSTTTLNKILNDDLSLRSGVIVKLLKGMNVKLKQLLYKEK